MSVVLALASIDTGIDWLGSIPAHWTVEPLRNATTFTTGWTPPTADDASYQGDNLWANISDLRVRHISTTAKMLSSEAVVASRIPESPIGSLLFSFKLSIGQVAIVKREMYTNEAIATFRESPRLSIPYAYYLLPIAVVQNATENIYGAKILNAQLIRSARLPLPPLDEQRQIAEYLDRETGQIDALIAKQEQLVETLTERRQAVIDTLTWRGVGSHELRKSGVDPAGLSPAHWKRIRNKQLFTERVDLSETGDETLLTVSHLTGVTPRADKNVNMIEAESLSGYKRVERFDLVVNTLWGWMGALGTSNYQGIVSPAYGVYAPRKQVSFDPWYLGHLYRSTPYVCEIGRHSKGVWSSRLRIYADSFMAMNSILPPLSEQREIVAQIDGATSKIDALIAKAREMIVVLRERRQALISAAVTGKIDVRGL